MLRGHINVFWARLARSVYFFVRRSVQVYPNREMTVVVTKRFGCPSQIHTPAIVHDVEAFKANKAWLKKLPPSDEKRKSSARANPLRL